MKPYYEDTKSGIVIWHGDCREILPTLPKVDLVLTDPPYGCGFVHGEGGGPSNTILDPFGGSGTTGQVALELGRNAILIELNPAYIKLANDRTFTTPGLALA